VVDRESDAGLSNLERLVDSGNIAEARKVFRSHDELQKGSVGPEYQFHMELIRAKIAALEGNYDEALSTSKSLLHSCRDKDDRYWSARSHVVISWILERLGRHLEAQEHCEAAVHYCRWEIDDKRLEGRAWNNLGVIHKNLGLWEQAGQDLKRALDAYAHVGEHALRLSALLNLGVIWRRAGHLVEAQDICSRGLHLAEESGGVACTSSTQMRQLVPKTNGHIPSILPV
jgi:tetratricopeptide (TPR) repeat protein